MANDPNFDPYEELGLDRDATAAEIHKAYRKKAAGAHPDAQGGSPEKFALVVLAKDVLSDAERRAKFDKTGKIDDAEGGPDNSDAESRELIAGIMNGLINAILDAEDKNMHVDIASMNFLHDIIENINMRLDEYSGLLAKSNKASKIASRALKRFRRKNKGGNMMERILQNRVDQECQRAEKYEKKIAVHKRAIEMLADYEFHTDRNPQQEAMQRAVEQMLTGGYRMWGASSS